MKDLGVLRYFINEADFNKSNESEYDNKSSDVNIIRNNYRLEDTIII